MELFETRGNAKYITSELDGNTYCKTNGQFSKHLRKYGMSVIDYFCKYLGEKGICEFCQADTAFVSSSWTFKSTCGKQACINKKLKLTYETKSIEEKEEWKERSQISLSKLYSSDIGKEIKEKISKSNKLKSFEARKKRTETLMAKCPEDPYNSKKANETKKLKSAEEWKNIIRKMNTTKFKKYGKSKCTEEALENLRINAKTKLRDGRRNFNLKKYGLEYIPPVIIKSRFSKSSKKFFDELLSISGIDGKEVNYAENEWFIQDSELGFLLYDFKFKNKIIEFNGDFWHANPSKYSPSDVLTFPGGDKKIAKDLWDKDSKKIKCAEDKGFDVLVVWESEVKSNPDILNDIKLWLLDETEIRINAKNKKVLTPSGYSNFIGIKKVVRTGNINFEFDDSTILECSFDHQIKIKNGIFTSAKDLKINDIVVGLSSDLKITNKIENKNKLICLYDLIEVDNGNEYYTNKILSHNCKMVSSDPLLINSMKLQQLKASPPLFEDHGFKFWRKEPDSSKTYYVGCDISVGLENDYSTIQVLEFPTMEQVAEFRSNTISPQQFYMRIKWILNYLKTPTTPTIGYNVKVPEVYWSFENNGVGAAIVALLQNDEKFPDATLLSDPNRFGMVTSGKSKLMACLELKRLVEKTTNGLKINSDFLITELKNYVSNGKTTYHAKPGATDDLIAAMLVVMNVLKKAADYEEEVFELIYNPEDEFEEDEFGGEPIPFVM